MPQKYAKGRKKPTQPPKNSAQSNRLEKPGSFLTYFRFTFLSNTVRAEQHTAVVRTSYLIVTPHNRHRRFVNIVVIRHIVLKREFLFGHQATIFVNTKFAI